MNPCILHNENMIELLKDGALDFLRLEYDPDILKHTLSAIHMDNTYHDWCKKARNGISINLLHDYHEEDDSDNFRIEISSLRDTLSMYIAYNDLISLIEYMNAQGIEFQ